MTLEILFILVVFAIPLLFCTFFSVFENEIADYFYEFSEKKKKNDKK